VDGVSPDSTGNVSFDGANGIYVQPYGTSNVVQVANNFVTERTENNPYITSTGVKPRGNESYPGYGICSQQDAELYFENGRQISKVIIRVKMDREWDGDITWTHGLYLRRRRTRFMSSGETVGECQPGNYVISGNEHTPQMQEITFLTDFTWLTPPEGQYGEDVLYVFFDTPEVPKTQFQYLQLEYTTTYETPVYTKVTTLHGVGGTPLELENPMKLVGTTAKPLLTEDDLPPIPPLAYTTADIDSPLLTTRSQYLEFKQSLPPIINHTVRFNFNADFDSICDSDYFENVATGTGAIRITIRQMDMPFVGTGTIVIRKATGSLDIQRTHWRSCQCRLVFNGTNQSLYNIDEVGQYILFDNCRHVDIPTVQTYDLNPLRIFADKCGTVAVGMIQQSVTLESYASMWAHVAGNSEVTFYNSSPSASGLLSYTVAPYAFLDPRESNVVRSGGGTFTIMKELPNAGNVRNRYKSMGLKMWYKGDICPSL
jgi:hypothetical protein